MPTVDTVFGSIHVTSRMEHYPSGMLMSCAPDKESFINTEYGIFTPQYSGDELRKRQCPYLTFHENGMVNVLPLEKQVVVRTPLGNIPAEKVTFYPDGSLKRIFPLNGSLSGYWGQEDEQALARPIRVKTPDGELEALIISLYLGPQGNLRSLTLWPGEVVKVKTAAGEVPVRMGISYYDCGALKSIEPDSPVSVITPIGKVLAYDPDAIGITGDKNSLLFSESGKLLSLKTVSHMFIIKGENGAVSRIEPLVRVSPMDGETFEPTPMTVSFNENWVHFSADKMKEVVARISSVHVQRYAQIFSLSA